MLENLITDKLDYKKLSPEEQQKRGILGRLVGVIADSKNATRNGRKYSEKLWENVFKDPIMQERIETNCCFGELGHPADREETDMEKIAICMDGLPKKDSNGRLQAVFNILDTPNGRILKTLCDYGCKIGVSSRGSGEVTSNFDGTEDVDPDSYECQGFDAVIIPAVKEARLNYVTEELDKTRYNKTLRAKLQESYDKASVDDKKIMKETFDNIGVDFKKSYPVEFTYTYEDDNTPYTNYFGHLNVVADSEQEALEKAEAYVNSPEYQNYNHNHHSFRNFRISDTKYTNVDLVEDNHGTIKYYAIIGYEPADGETGMSGDKFFIDSEVVAAESEQEAIKKLGASATDNVQEVSKQDYEEYKEYIANQDANYVDLDVNEILGESIRSDIKIYPGKELTTKSGHKIIIDSVNAYFNPDTGSPAVYIDYSYKLADGEEGKGDYCTTQDLMYMLQEDLTIDELLNEAKFGLYKYTYGVHVIGNDGRDRTLGGAKTLEDAEQIGIDQAKQVMENPWMSDSEKMRYFENMYISNDDKEIEVATSDFENYLDNLMSELDSRIKASKDEVSEAIQSTKPMPYEKAKEYAASKGFQLDKDTYDAILKIAGVSNIEEVNNDAVDNNEAIVEQLQKLLQHNTELESKVIDLQEKLSVCYAKENSTEEKIASYRTAIKTLTEDNKKSSAIVEKLNTTKEKLDDSNKRITTLESLLKTSLSSKRDLKERLSEKTNEVSELKEQLDAVNISKEKLNEDLNGSEKERDLLKKQYEEKLDNSRQLIEKYKTVAKTAVNKYINSQAVRIGVKPEEIKNKLPESYGFKDIDSICEDLKKYKVSVGRLPFNTTMLRENKVQMSATPSKNDPLTMLGNTDDDVDSQLLSLAKIN